MVNKYGKEVNLPGAKDTEPEREIEQILKSLGVEYRMQFFFDEVGLRRKKYDAAVFKDGELAFLVEFDGAAHYSPKYYEDCGTRPERCKIHVVRAQLAAARAAKVATQKGVPLLRLDNLHRGEMLRDILLSWVWTFVDGSEEKSPEVNAVKMLDAHGWDFDYVEPSAQSKEEQRFLEERRKEG